jgi:hypothetical protein
VASDPNTLLAQERAARSLKSESGGGA